VIAEKEALFACDHHCIIRYRASFSDTQVPPGVGRYLTPLTPLTTLTTLTTQ